MNKFGYVYIMTNKNKTTLYIGVTNDLVRRVYEHKNHLIKHSFTDRYNLEYCIYYEEFLYFDLAIHREKELKKWNRQKKEDLINKKNPEWKVLVNERGFIRERQEIPPCGRNDSAPCDSKGEGGGKAAAFQSSSLNDIVVIPNGTQCSEETQPLCTPKTQSFRKSVTTEETQIIE